MTITKPNAIAASLIAVANSIFPFLVLVGLLHWTSDTIAAAILVIGNLVNFGGLLFSAVPASNTPPPTPPGG